MAGIPNESSVGIPGGTNVAVDVVLLSTPNVTDPKTNARNRDILGAGATTLPNVARQVFVLGDQADAGAIAAILEGFSPPSGSEAALVVSVSPSSPNDLVQIELLSALLRETQNLVTLLGGLPVTASRPNI